MKAAFFVRPIVLALAPASLASVARSALARPRLALGVALVGASVAAGPAMPALARSTPNVIKLHAVLTARGELPPQEVKWPSVKGVFDATIDRAKQTITWRLTFSGASSHVFAAHIHGGGRRTESQRSTLLLELCGDPGVTGTAHRCVSGVHATYGQEGGLYPDTIREILKASFVNIHTLKNSDGEARGQLVIVK